MKFHSRRDSHGTLSIRRGTQPLLLTTLPFAAGLLQALALLKALGEAAASGLYRTAGER